MNIYCRSLLVSLFLLFSFPLKAFPWWYGKDWLNTLSEGYCKNEIDSHIFNANINGTIPSANNQVGSEIVGIAQYRASDNSVGEVLCRCNPGGSQDRYFRAKLHVPTITYNGEQYLRINAYIAIKLNIKLLTDGYNSQFVNIADMVSNYAVNRINHDDCGRLTSTPSATRWIHISKRDVVTGSEGNMDLLILRPIVNSIQFSGVIASLYMTPSETGSAKFNPVGTNPVWAQIGLDINLDAEGFSCTPNSPSYTVNFGSLSADQFGSIGQPATGATKPLDIRINCDFKADNAVSMGLIATPSVALPDAIKTEGGTNVAIVVQQRENSAQTILSPSDQNVVRHDTYQQTSNAQPHEYRFNLQAYPTKTATEVNYGDFNATATIQLSFD